ncbi:hypothetical protein CANTEDRAFT_111367 [Yamadazyma tenuis ATCC 10573]|uniref:Nucleoporin n=2 Tax=Candida tenuis TaxID=2315449 RepID=G3BEV0_CANTC|nr:uncharacterized protein CANTEDRAFT_111367 [Yamadazyma tenuis ATCC 10573]EGV60599.1 hypothetical protein CANTEDRAFT_111367 [Yamadazyma tenuis ATCC 10573]
MLNWSNDTFLECYNSIKYQDHSRIDEQLVKAIQNDLNSVLVTPPNDESSKSKLIDNKSPTQFTNGDKLKLNDMFVENAIFLSKELGLNELATAEVLFYSSRDGIDNGASFIDQGRSAFFKRYQYILNILGYLITSRQLHLLTSDFNNFGSNVLDSFSKIYSIINNLNDLINKNTVTNSLNDVFIQTIEYTKTELFNCHELLGQILYNMIQYYFEEYGTVKFYKQIMTHLNSNVDDNDSIILHYLPGVFAIFDSLDKFNDQAVNELHKTVTNTLTDDFKLISLSPDLIDLSNSKLKSYEILMDFVFLTNLIPWCKETGNLEMFHFNEDILNYIQICLNYGVLENLLRFTSATSNLETVKLFEVNNLCEFRSLLQTNFPELSVLKFSKLNDNNAQSRFNLKLEVSSTFKEDLLPFYWHKFFSNFIKNVAIVLTQLRDSEEDYLLSSINRRQRVRDKGEKDSNNELVDGSSKDSSQALEKNIELDMEDMYTRADLERFYLSFVYTYKNRPNLCALIWEDGDTNNELVGFINWGVNNNSSPFITATFCLLLSSLTCKEDALSTIKIWENLINNNSNLKKSDYSKISMDSIVDSLEYYLNSLNENFENDLNDQIRKKQKGQEFLLSNALNNNHNSNKILIELSEDSMIFISGFVLLISSLVDNLSDDSERSKEIRQSMFNRFKPIILGFLKFDNLIMNSRILIGSNDFPLILVNENNRSTLINLMLNLLSSFNDPHAEDLELRYEIWDIVDKWMFHQLIDNNSSSRSPGVIDHHNPSPSEKIRLQKNTISIKNAFKTNLVDLPNILNFIELITNLLNSPENPSRINSKLLYPANLGNGYRFNNQTGIWPYIEFITLEVLGSSTKIKHSLTRVNLQNNLISLVLGSLNSVDWEFLDDILPNVSQDFKVESLFDASLTYDQFIKLHHSIGVMNYVFDEKVYKSIIEIILKEEDDTLVLSSLKIVHKLIKLQDIFAIMVSRLKANEQPKPTLPSTSLLSVIPALNTYYPSNFNVIDFLKVLSSNVALVTKFGLLIGTDNNKIVSLCIDLLTKVNRRFLDLNKDETLLIKNKLLTVFASGPESNQLRYSIINQFTDGDEDIKFKILNFLVEDLAISKGSPCFAHHLLGYTVKGNYLVINEDDSKLFIRNLTEHLVLSLSMVSSVDFNNGINIIEYNYTRMSSLVLQILNRLCHFPVSSLVTLQLLRDFESDEEVSFFETLLSYQTKIDHTTVWYNVRFNDDLLKENDFILDKESLLTFFEFFKMRNLMIQYLTVEFHHLSQQGSIYKKNQYLDKLINGDKFLNESHQVLKFLDVLNFKFSNFEQFNYQKFSKWNLSLLFKEVKSEDNIFNTDILDKLETITNNVEILDMKDFLVKFIVNDDLKALQLNYLHSWVQLIEVIINDGKLSKEQNQNFILEILSSILPKINEFFEKDIKFSEELISLCVILFDYYEEDNLFIERLLLLFSTCIKGIASSNSTIELRNDLYIIMNNFLQKSFKNNSETILRKLTDILEKTDVKFFEIICNDSIVSEGSIRITSMIFLESTIHLFNHFNNSFITDQLTKNNSLLLIIRSIKRIDEILDNELKEVSTILYELINFNSIINLLIRIGQSRLGSSYLIQSELFSIIKNLNILKVDPDLGMNLRINEINSVNLSLDSNYSFINYFQFLLPVFKLISVLLISMGPSYKPSKIQGKELLAHFGKLRNSIIKKDILINENKIKYQYEGELDELMNQFVLIDTLVDS